MYSRFRFPIHCPARTTLPRSAPASARPRGLGFCIFCRGLLASFSAQQDFVFSISSPYRGQILPLEKSMSKRLPSSLNMLRPHKCITLGPALRMGFKTMTRLSHWRVVKTPPPTHPMTVYYFLRSPMMPARFPYQFMVQRISAGQHLQELPIPAFFALPPIPAPAIFSSRNSIPLHREHQQSPSPGTEQCPLSTPDGQCPLAGSMDARDVT